MPDIGKKLEIKKYMSAGDLEVLILLYQSPRGHGELRRIMGIANPSEYIGRLKEDGFVMVSDAAYGTPNRYSITPKGREFLEMIKDAIEDSGL